MSGLERPNPLDRIRNFARASCIIHTCFLAITASFKPPAIPQTACEGFLRRPSYALPNRPNGIESTDYFFRSAVGAALTLEGITRESLPRTGRAILMASSSTGEQWCAVIRPAAGWSVPRPLDRLAPDTVRLGRLYRVHCTRQSTTPNTFFMLAFGRGTVRVELVQGE